MKKFLSVLMACLILGSAAAVQASAAAPSDDGSVASPCYEESGKATSKLAIIGKDATCESTVKGESGKTTKIVVTQTLQMRDGNSWRRVTDWTATYYASSCTFSNTRYGLNGGTYRVKTEAKIYTGTSYETVYGYSGECSC